MTPSKVHFLYLAQSSPPRQHYVRYDRQTGNRDKDLQPNFGDGRAAIRGLDGFFAVDRKEKETVLYCIGRDPEGHVVCLRSADEGETWNPHAKTRETYQVYSLGGCRTSCLIGTKGGKPYIIGSFTDQRGDNASGEQKSRVFFFRIPLS